MVSGLRIHDSRFKVQGPEIRIRVARFAVLKFYRGTSLIRSSPPP